VPCYRCDTRQTDPTRGASPWRRAVIADVQVLVCPDCQRVHDWTADVDRCAGCGSTALVRQLGETHCRDCGHVGAGNPAGTAEAAVRRAATASPSQLSDDVGAALQRLRDNPAAGL
jgi:hypothetical protein